LGQALARIVRGLLCAPPLVATDERIAGAAGGSGRATTGQDLARFLDALPMGRLFRHRATPKEMLTFGRTPGEVASGYGLGVEQYTVPGDIELIGHLGGRRDPPRVRRPPASRGATVAFAMNFQDDPSHSSSRW
jgi:hypothetical protein